MTTTPTIWIAGTSYRTASCVQTLMADERFLVRGVITPVAKPMGRKKLLTPNPVAGIAEEYTLPTIFVEEERLNRAVKTQLEPHSPPDLLLVVDFGYFVPKWLLSWPTIAPINIHPSALPAWRGSSPGQFVLLYAEKSSAVTTMVMNEGLDTGPIITQFPFQVDETWNTQQYYQHAFALVNTHLGDTLLAFIAHPEKVIPQPEESPTPIARKITTEDGRIEWNVLLALLKQQQAPDWAPIGGISPLLLEAQAEKANIYQVIRHACKALSPWPGLWTIAPTIKGEKRVKILELHSSATHALQLGKLQVEGQQPADWQQLKSLIPSLKKV